MLSASFPVVSTTAPAVSGRTFIKTEESSPGYSSIKTDSFQTSKTHQATVPFSGVFGPLAIAPTDEELQNIEQHLPAVQGNVAFFRLSADQANNTFYYYIATAKDALAAWVARRQQIQGQANGDNTLEASGDEALEQLAEKAQNRHPASLDSRH